MAVSLQQIVIFHDERPCCILLPRNIIFFHEIITQFCPIFQFYQTIRLLEGDLLDKIKLSVFYGKQNADMTDKQRIIRIRKFVMQNDGNQACLVVCKRNAAFPPACLQSLDLLGYIGTVCSIYRCEQSTEFGGTVSAENRGIRRKRFKIQKKRILALGIRLISSHCDKVAE